MEGRGREGLREGGENGEGNYSKGVQISQHCSTKVQRTQLSLV